MYREMLSVKFVVIALLYMYVYVFMCVNVTNSLEEENN